MKFLPMIFIISIGLCSFMCGGSSQTVKLGDCPLTVTVTAEGDGFDGYADVYIDGKFIGTTDSQSRTLRIDLKKGEYTVIVAAEGFKPWKSKILMLGAGYKQSALARLKKVQEPNTESPEL